MYMKPLKKLITEAQNLNQEERKSLVNKIRKNIPFIYSDLEVHKFLDLPLTIKYTYDEDNNIYKKRGWTLSFNKTHNFWALHKWNEGFKGKYKPMTFPFQPIPTERDYE